MFKDNLVQLRRYNQLTQEELADIIRQNMEAGRE